MSTTTLSDAGVSTPLSPEVIQAITILQKYCSASIKTTTIEQFEHALDELLRNPKQVGDPKRIAYSAVRNARKFTYERLKIVPLVPYEETIDSPIDSSAEEYQLVSDIGDFVNHSISDQRDQKILRALLAGYQADDIAKAMNVPLARAQVWISRARKRAARAWLTFG